MPRWKPKRGGKEKPRECSGVATVIEKAHSQRGFQKFGGFISETQHLASGQHSRSTQANTHKHTVSCILKPKCYERWNSHLSFSIKPIPSNPTMNKHSCTLSYLTVTWIRISFFSVRRGLRSATINKNYGFKIPCFFFFSRNTKVIQNYHGFTLVQISR